MKKFITTLFCSIILISLHAQPLEKVGGGINGAYINDLALYNGNLYAGGYFTPGGTAKDHVYYFNGSQWQSMKGGVTSANFFAFISAFAQFDNKLFICGGFEKAGTFSTEDIGIWNGTDWEDPKGGVNGAFRLNKFGNKLYAGVYTVKEGWIKPFWEWKGNSWQQHPDSFNVGTNTDSHLAGILTMCEYKGKMIVGGVFNQVNGTPVNNIAAWDGNSWQPLGDGVAGYVRTMQEWKGELYVGGDFDTAGGIPTKWLARWDGNTWKAVNNTTFDQRVRALAVYNGNLWIGGDFFTPNRGILKYDGTNFTVPFTPDNSVGAFLVDGNSLLVAGSFKVIGGQNYSLIARYTEPGLGTAEANKTPISVYPNPAVNTITINLNTPVTEKAIVTIYDNLGREVLCNQYETTGTLTMPISNLPSGTYYITAQAGTYYSGTHFIKE